MNLSYSVQFAGMRASAEGKYAHCDNPGIEYWFLGILKLSELTAGETFRLPEGELAAIDEDIAAVKEALKERGIDSGAMRARLRHVLKRGAASDPDSVTAYLLKAMEAARRRGAREVWARDLLLVILENPTETLREHLPDKPGRKYGADMADVKPGGKEKEKNPGSDGAGKQSDGDGKPGEETGPHFLPELTARVRRMRATLLSTVQGQDHVVHAFAEGVFAAEVLASSDEDRVRPKAIFAFVGPPGVGKTFLAQQAAQALGMPFMRFDMSTYADHQSYTGLVGFEPSYKEAKEGLLTGFVKKNPASILLFDEIEKAHLNTVQLFLQILDAGHLADRFLGEDVSFKDTIIIFTSNAGRSLYEGEARQNAAGVSRSVLLQALETEKDPRTGAPFFPAAITSRLATGWPLLFNHLMPHDLELISRRELERVGGLFKKQYGIETEFDPRIATALLFREGGAADARTLRAQTELFFKNEVFKVCRLWGEDRFNEVVEKLRTVRFTLDTGDIPEEARALFFSEDKPEILLFGNPTLALACRLMMPGFIFHDTDNVEEALRIAGEKDISLALLDMTGGSSGDPMATMAENKNMEDLLMSGAGFEFLPMAVSVFKDGRSLFRMLRERLPELPVYLLETDELPLDDEVTMSFVRAGARGRLTVPTDDFSVLEDQLDTISGQLFAQRAAARLAAEHKQLSFETAPRLSDNNQEVTIRLRELTLRRTPAAEDADSVLDEVEKPNVRFSDVIGCRDAKDELRFFIDYLKNPKKFSAQGLKPPKGVLLYGPPGTGKTMLAKAMAGESDVAFIPSAASSFVTKYQGSGSEAVRKLFKQARKYAPAIIFIDELDAIGRKRGGENSAHAEEMALNALLTEMDGFAVDPRRPVFVLAATNFEVEEGRRGIGVMDPALVRRFDRRVLVDLPNAGDREELLHVLLAKAPASLVTDDMIHRTAERAVGMSPANLTSVVDLASRMAAKAGRPMDDAILDEAFELTQHGEKKDWGYEYLERVARHESGHAYMCWLGGNTPSYLTIVARGDHGGYMEHASREMSPLSTREELINRIRTSLGGRAAEIVYYGEKDGISTGASGDLEQATRIAAAMLCAYGMDEEFGLVTMDPREAMRDAAFRKRVNEILRKELRETIDLIRAARPRIDRLVSELLKRNKMNGQEIEAALAK